MNVEPSSTSEKTAVDKLLRQFTTAELRAEVRRRERMEELIADDEIWDLPRRGER